MSYWVIKEKPRGREIFDWSPSDVDTWYTGKPPKRWLPGDRLFFWLGAPSLRLTCLGVFKGINKNKVDEKGRTLFDVRYATNVFERPLYIDELRKRFSRNLPSFLKAGPSGTVYPLTDEQGKKLYRIVTKYNPSTRGLWKDLDDETSAKVPTGSSVSAPPSRIKVTTIRIVRDTARARLLKVKYGFRCQVCNERIEISPARYYAEAHHVRPLGGRHKGLDEEGNMLVLCPNHHAMFDFGIPKFTSGKIIMIGGQKFTL